MGIKKDLNDAKFLDAFGRGLIYDRAEIPTPKEMTDFVFDLKRQNRELKQKLVDAEHEIKCANQQFSVFALEVGNLAGKYQK